MSEFIPVSFRFSKEMRQRLKECSERTGIAERTIAQLAIQAAVDAIEQNDYRLVVPITFEVADKISPQFSANARRTIPKNEDEQMLAAEKPATQMHSGPTATVIKSYQADRKRTKQPKLGPLPPKNQESNG